MRTPDAAGRVTPTDQTRTWQPTVFRRRTSSKLQHVEAWKPSLPMTASCTSKSAEESYRHWLQSPTRESFVSLVPIACMIFRALTETRNSSADIVESQRSAESTVISPHPTSSFNVAEKRGRCQLQGKKVTPP